MTKADQKVESAADKLERFVAEAQRERRREGEGRRGARRRPRVPAQAEAEPDQARAKGEAPTNEPPAAAPRRPARSSAAEAEAKRGGPSPWLVIGAALAAGYVLAKVLDWRGHAHPRV